MLEIMALSARFSTAWRHAWDDRVVSGRVSWPAGSPTVPCALREAAARGGHSGAGRRPAWRHRRAAVAAAHEQAARFGLGPGADQHDKLSHNLMSWDYSSGHIFNPRHNSSGRDVTGRPSAPMRSQYRPRLSARKAFFPIRHHSIRR